MESQQVVLIKTSATDGSSTVETTMRAVPVVVVKPVGELSVAFARIQIGTGVSPFP